MFRMQLLVIVWYGKYGGDITRHVGVLGYVAGQDTSPIRSMWNVYPPLFTRMSLEFPLLGVFPSRAYAGLPG